LQKVSICPSTHVGTDLTFDETLILDDRLTFFSVARQESRSRHALVYPAHDPR
jgi:hypothetical protein